MGSKAQGSGPVRLLAVLALVATTGLAHAGRGDHGTAADEIEVEIGNLVAHADFLERSAQPGRGFMTPESAVQRYKDCVYYHLVGEYAQAAEGFYALVATASLTDAGLHSDAEWYLAESLYKLGNLRTSESNYQAIADRASHPFREDSVRRLLEIYAELRDDEAFDRLYESEILSGRTRSSDLVTYAVGRAFFRKGDLPQSKSSLKEIAPESAHYRKARYIYGAIMVREKNLETAAQVFKSIVALPVETTDDRRVLDLSLLALGRIYMELGLFGEASEHYAKIGMDSEYLEDKLYEEIWTLVKQREELRQVRLKAESKSDGVESAKLQRREQELVRQAIRGVDIFLLRFSEHKYSARMRLLRGHLYIQAVEYQMAIDAYEGVIADYSPVRERLRELANSADKPRAYFQQILGGADAYSMDSDLPAYARAMVLADRDLSRALTIFSDIESQKQMLKASRVLIDELEQALTTDATIGAFQKLRYDTQFARTQVVQRHFDLLEIEDRILVDSLSGEQKRQFSSMEQEREQRKTTALKAIANGDGRGGQGEVGNLRQARQGLRGSVRGPGERDLLSRLDRLHGALIEVEGQLVRAEGRFDPVEREEMGRIRSRFEEEIAQVHSQERDLELTLVEAQEVSVALTRSGFGRLEDFFADSVMRADVGIVDVYWARKVQVTDERKRLLEEKNALRTRILQRFEHIEQKLRH